MYKRQSDYILFGRARGEGAFFIFALFFPRSGLLLWRYAALTSIARWFHSSLLSGLAVFVFVFVFVLFFVFAISFFFFFFALIRYLAFGIWHVWHVVFFRWWRWDRALFCIREENLLFTSTIVYRKSLLSGKQRLIATAFKRECKERERERKSESESESERARKLSV